MSDYYSQDPDGEFGDGAGAHSAACGPQELKSLLQRIAAHIADADVRHGSVLEDMHGRLVHLGDETRAIRDAVPPGLNAALARFENSLASSQGRIDYATPAPPDNDDDVEGHTAHNNELGNELNQPSLAATTRVPSNPRAQADADWDRMSAEALARVYEGVPTEPDDASHDDFTASMAGAPSPEDFIAEASPYDDQSCATNESVPHATPLAPSRNENTLAFLDMRFQAFEQRLGEILDNVARRSDVEGLELIETHISALSRHVAQTQQQLERLDSLEAQLARVGNSLSDERLERLIGDASLTDRYLERLAGALASRLAQQRPGADANNPGTAKLDELSALVQQFASDYRQAEETTASALGTVQQAMVHLLDRMDDLEPNSAWAPYDAANREDDLSQRSAGEEALARVYHHQAEDTSATPRSGTGPTGLANITAEIGEARAAAHADPREVHEPSAAQADTRAPANPSALSPPLPASREEFVAAARRAARQASELPSNIAAPAVNPRAMAGGRRKALARPLTGLMMATLVVVIAVGAGLTTYNFIKAEPIHSAMQTHSSLLLQETANANDRPATHDSAEAASETSDSVLIDDDALPSNAQAPAAPGPRAEPPAGIMLETGSLYSTEDLARNEQRRRMAQLSTNLGAAQGVQSTPAALIPGSADRTLAAPSAGAGATQPPSLPPAAIGPLSLRIAAANGDPSAEFEVAGRFAEGKGVQQDFKQAAAWYQRSAARGYAPAQYRLGALYERGLGVNADLGRAKAWYRSAAEKGNIKAMHNLAVLSAGGVPADYRTAAHWFAEAADRGVRDSQFNLAVLLESGIGVQQDLKAAYGWFKIAAQGGDKEASRRVEQLKHRLLAAEAATGEAFARDWRAKATDPLINDARAAGEAWRLRDASIAG